MQLHEIKTKNKRETKKRVGRGGKRGTYSGKGQKGQKSRAGAKIRPAMRDILISTPKLRGYRNKPKSPKYTAINLSDLNKIKEERITKNTLIENKLIRKNELVKILGNGKIESPKKIVKIKTSKTASEKIIKAGGNIE